MLQLSPRLALCAELVRPGRALADIGTDHAYLPIWLLQNGKIPRALACDVNPGPLEAAQRNARRYGIGQELRLALSDGLREVGPGEAEDIVIAGMGGELILRIVEEAPWLRDGTKRLVLQPMSMVDRLRAGLWELGFPIRQERAVVDGGKAYSAFAAEYAGSLPAYDRLYPYMGLLGPEDPAANSYAVKTARGLLNRLRGAEHEGDQKTAEELRLVLEELSRRYG